MMRFPFQNTYARLSHEFHQPASPEVVTNPELIIYNEKLGHELGIELTSENAREIFSGNQLPEGAEPLAMAYSGHQFGQFNPQLGDGRAILLGELSGKDVQLKGAGRTPFSRRGDGRSALGPVLREYLVSEAMHQFGIPTTRALAAVTTGEKVLREEAEPGGVFTRVAQSHLRIGTVQHFAARKDHESLRQLVFYANTRHFPEAIDALDLLENVMKRQASLIAKWMSVGFIHGVMNTDNMTLSGETIDYGPCAFMDHYDPQKKFSFIDQGGRYAYGNQPGIAQWNLARLAEALCPLIDDDGGKAVAAATEVLQKFPQFFEEAQSKVFFRKLGLTHGDWSLVQGLHDLMEQDRADFTLVYRHLTKGEESFVAQFKNEVAARIWWQHWQDQSPSLALARRTNPIFIPRNHRIAEVIDAAYRGDFTPFHQLHQILTNPFDEQPEHVEYEQAPEPDEVVAHTFCGT